MSKSKKLIYYSANSANSHSAADNLLYEKLQDAEDSR
jgi:hypothetical protein